MLDNHTVNPKKQNTYNSSMQKLLLFLLTFCALAPSTRQLNAADAKKLLLVSVTQGFRHSSIEVGEKILQQLAERSGAFTLDLASVSPREARFALPPEEPSAEADQNNPGRRPGRRRPRIDTQAYNQAVKDVLHAKMSPEALKAYDGVIFLNTTGTLPIPDVAFFQQWIHSGAAFIGMHSASDTFHGEGEPSEYTKMLNGEFLTHGRQETVALHNVDPEHAANQPLEKIWTVHDEMYLFKNYHRSLAHSLLNMEEHPNERTPGHYPVSWCRSYGQGRVFYSSLGHREDMWDPEWKDRNGERLNSPENARAYQQHVLGGILWALGLAEGDSQPQVTTDTVK
ncbi:MAG: ThuA domain-containing protein [Limisphaerales bacterium]